jgi:hypothetical protein
LETMIIHADLYEPYRHLPLRFPISNPLLFEGSTEATLRANQSYFEFITRRKYYLGPATNDAC